jgi:ABC-type phosphate transport system auxiliary subunit
MIFFIVELEAEKQRSLQFEEELRKRNEQIQQLERQVNDMRQQRERDIQTLTRELESQRKRNEEYERRFIPSF